MAIGLFLVKNDGVLGLRAAIVPVALPGFEKCEMAIFHALVAANYLPMKYYFILHEVLLHGMK